MQLHLKGGARAQLLADIRTLKTFRVIGGKTKVEIFSLWTDPDTRLAWVECSSGTWRLPDVLYPWAEDVEERAASLGFGDLWPCTAVFEEKLGGVMVAEVLPDGYRPVGR